MSNSETYLVNFNMIENHMRQGLNQESYVPFSRLVDEMSNKNYLINKNKRLLKHLADIRNIIVHKKGMDHLAFPSDAASKALIEIKDKLLNPKSIFDLVKNDVHVISEEVALSDVLSKIKEYQFSQFPVYINGEFKGLITSNAITIWLAKNKEDDHSLIEDLSEVNVTDILDYTEETDTVEFVSRKMNVNEFVQKYILSTSLTRIWIITENGKTDENPLSIITMYDYDKIFGYFSS